MDISVRTIHHESHIFPGSVLVSEGAWTATVREYMLNWTDAIRAPVYRLIRSVGNELFKYYKNILVTFSWEIFLNTKLHFYVTFLYK